MGLDEAFRLLGVDMSVAEASVIQAAFRREARKIHPDSGGLGSSEDMNRLIEAREVARRHLGKIPNEQAASREPGTPFDDLFEKFNAYGRGRHEGRDVLLGADIEALVSVSESILRSGGTVRWVRRCDCPACDPKSADDFLCRVCGGEGKKTEARGVVSMRVQCPVCKGEGRVPAKRAPCISPGANPVEIEVPAGSADGRTIIVKGFGMPGPKGRGDLIATLSVERPAAEPPKPRRYSVDVSLIEAACGGIVHADIAGLGLVKIVVPAGTQNGRIFRCRVGGVIVDLVAKVLIPDASEDPLRSLFERMRGLL